MMRLGFAVMLGMGAFGCIDRMILDGTIKGTRDASKSFDELPDFETARSAAAAGLVQLQGFHQLAPDNEDALFMLAQSWAGYTSGFIEEEWELAQDRGDDDAEAYHRARAMRTYGRAIHYGVMLLERKVPGFEAATRNADTMAAYLSGFGKDQAETLLWLGVAWMGRGGVGQDDPEVVANLFIGVALVERSIALDDSLAYGLGSAVLGAYHARSPDAELKQAKELFDTSLAKAQRRALTNLMLMAQSYSCNTKDRAGYDALIREVLDASEDVLPEQRLANLIAKRKALRYSARPRLQRCGWE